MLRSLLVISICSLIFISCGKKEEVPYTTGLPSNHPPVNAGTMLQQSQTTAPVVEDGWIKFGSLTGKLPEGWTSRPPASPMRAAEITLNKVENDPEDGLMVAFYFGPDAGGIEPNIDRWVNQFESPDGSLLKEKLLREEFIVNEMRVILVHFTGIQREIAMPGAPTTPRMENWMNMSAIVVTPEGPWFLKGTGPVKTMEMHKENFKTFLNSLKKA